MRHGHDIGERRVVAPRDALPRDDLVGENLQLLDQHRGLDGVEPPGHADAHVVVTVGPLPVIAQGSDRVGERIVVGEHRPAVAVAAERLCGKEAGRRDRRERADLAALRLRAEGLRGVIDHIELVLFGDRPHRLIVGRKSEQVDRHQRLRLEAGALRRRNRAFDAGGIDVEGLLVDLTEHRRRADERHRFGRGRIGERRADHGVAAPDALRHQHQHQRIGAARDPDRVPGAAEFGQRPLELTDFRPIDELAMLGDARDRVVDLLPEAAALRRHVDERNHVDTRVLVHHKSEASMRQPATLRGLRGARGMPPCRQRMATSRLATPSAPVTAGGSPLRTALTKAISSERNGSEWPAERCRIE